MAISGHSSSTSLTHAHLITSRRGNMVCILPITSTSMDNVAPVSTPPVGPNMVISYPEFISRQQRLISTQTTLACMHTYLPKVIGSQIITHNYICRGGGQSNAVGPFVVTHMRL